MADEDLIATPPTPEELKAAEQLRSDLERGIAKAKTSDDWALAAAVRNVMLGPELSKEELGELVSAALDLAPTEEELVHSSALRERLQAGADPVAQALKAAIRPSAIDAEEHKTIVRVAQRVSDQRGRGQVIRVAFGFTAALALAAALLLWFRRPDSTPSHDAVAYIGLRSTQPLFGEPFRAGEGSARVDRIAVARASDLRENRFTRWGLR